MGKAFLYGSVGRAMNTKVIVTLTATDSSSMAGRVITVVNTEDDTTIKEVTYTGQPATILVPVATHYRVSVSWVSGYVPPAAVEYTAIANTPRAITMQYRFAGGDLANYSWDEINRIGALGRAAEYFSIGKTKQVALTTGEIITLVLVGFNSDALASDPTTFAPYSFHMQNSMNTKQQMELTHTNVNGWNGCRMRTTVLPEILLTLPAELQSVIKTVVKKSSAGNQSSDIVQTNDKLWLASEIEIFGTLTCSKSGEGSQYPYYATSGNRVKMVSNVAASWWERSPYAANATSFCVVYTPGTANNGSAGSSNGVAFGLCV